jgi:hypothetical protein
MKPPNAGCHRKKFQTFSVSGGSKGESLFDVGDNALDAPTSAFDFRGGFPK